MPAIDKLELNELINQALKENVVSISFNVGNYPIMKTQTGLKSLDNRPILTKEFLDTIADSLLSDSQKDILKQNKESTIGYNWSDNIKLIINFFYQKDSLSITIKLTPAIVMDLNKIRVPKVINDIIKLKSGLVIICGAVNSGRTSTVASILQYINNGQEKRIVSIEDPIEYEFLNEKCIVQQREIGKDVDSFIQGMNDVIDEDVNIVYLSRIKSSEEIKTALQVAASGKLVFAVMEGDSAVTILDMIYNSFDLSEREWAVGLITGSLKVIINQALLPKVGGGQVLAFEVFTMSSSAKSIIKSGRLDQLNSLIQTSKQDNMQDLKSDLKNLVNKGLIKLEDANNVFSDTSF